MPTARDPKRRQTAAIPTEPSAENETRKGGTMGIFVIIMLLIVIIKLVDIDKRLKRDADQQERIAHRLEQIVKELRQK